MQDQVNFGLKEVYVPIREVFTLTKINKQLLMIYIKLKTVGIDSAKTSSKIIKFIFYLF